MHAADFNYYYSSTIEMNSSVANRLSQNYGNKYGPYCTYCFYCASIAKLLLHYNPKNVGVHTVRRLSKVASLT